MTYRLTQRDATLLCEVLREEFASEESPRTARLIAPDLVELDPQWRPSARHRERAARAVRTAREKSLEGAAIYDLVDHSDAGVVCRVILRAAHSEQAWAWDSAMTGDPLDDAGHLDKAAELRQLAHLIDRHYDDHPSEGQVIAHLARELEIAQVERGAGHSRRRRLAATLRELLDEAEPAGAEPLPYRSAEGELSYPSVRVA